MPYGASITLERLQMIQQAEAFLQELGFTAVRVRYDGRIASIEVHPAQLESFLADREEIVIFFKKLGYTHIALDLEGYRRGSNNEGIIK
jgi:uncharacterized protein